MHPGPKNIRPADKILLSTAFNRDFNAKEGYSNDGGDFQPDLPKVFETR